MRSQIQYSRFSRPMIFLRTIIALIVILATFATASQAEVEEPGTICSAQFENDLFGGGTDRHFTHGTAFSCLTEPIPWIVKAADKLPWFTYEKAREGEADLQARASISLGQNIYTPEDITKKELIEEDRPYGGWLYLGFGLVANQGSRRFDKIELTLGMVGPWSMAEEVQKTWHSFFDFREPRGWDNQLDNEPAVNLFYEQPGVLIKGAFLPGWSTTSCRISAAPSEMSSPTPPPASLCGSGLTSTRISDPRGFAPAFRVEGSSATAPASTGISLPEWKGGPYYATSFSTATPSPTATR